MAFKVFDRYEIELASLANIAQVLSHPARLLIVQFLIDGPKPYKSICSELQLAETTVSYHLNELRDHRLIYYEVVGGNVVIYHPKTSTLKEYAEVVGRFFDDLLDEESCLSSGI